jgi:integrase
LGQTDWAVIASLKAKDVDSENRTIGFTRKKTGVPVILHWSDEALNTLKDYPVIAGRIGGTFYYRRTQNRNVVHCRRYPRRGIVCRSQARGDTRGI